MPLVTSSIAPEQQQQQDDESTSPLPHLPVDIRIYDILHPHQPQSNNKTTFKFLDQIDPTTQLSPSHTVNIQEAHDKALLHIGNWIYIVDDKSRLLFLKRTEDLVLCPNAWSLLGEHASVKHDEETIEGDGDEGVWDADGIAKRTTLRAIREELGDVVAHHVVSITPLTPHPVFFLRDYGEEFGGRVDRQLTYMHYVTLNVTGGDSLDDEDGGGWHFDEEVADTAWVSVYEASEFVETVDFCHERMEALFRLGLKALLELLDQEADR